MNSPAKPNAGSAQASPLGKASAYSSRYAPELLFAIPRQEKRAELGLTPSALPFKGWDLWNAYEISWLNPRGKPQVALGEFRVPAHSPCLVESKSLKLYLNSFNQSRFDEVANLTGIIARDLSLAAGAPVEVRLQTLDTYPSRPIGYPQGFLLDTLEVDIEHYHPQPSLLGAGGPEVEETLYSHLLKSNCLVTGQPDWAMLGVRYRGPAIQRAGLLKYIISYREHHEFHEQCVERIFCDLMSHCRPDTLVVWARYTRRGGLDINPLRMSAHINLPSGPDFGLAEVRQ